MIELKNIVVKFDNFTALHNINVHVKEGEFFTFLGPSGCGKTTTLRTITGFIEPVEGTVSVKGRDITHVPIEDRNIGIVFQSYALFPTMTVYDNIAFGLKVKKLKKAEIDRKVREIARKVDLSDEQLAKAVSQLSGGQQQRVAIGRAVIRRPKLFLMDEPFSNLDPALRVQMRQVIRQLHETLGTTFLYVTHDQREALALGTRIAVMKDGMLRQFGTPAQIFNTPEDRFVAEFVGEPPMNFLEKLPVQSENGRSFVHILGQHYAVNCPPGQTVDAGFRPVHLVLSANGFPAQVTQALQADGELHLSLDADGTPLRAVLPSDTPLPLRGQVLHFQLSPKYLHFFDPGTGKRLP